MSSIFDNPITVPEDELTQSRGAWPVGNYLATFVNAELKDNDEGWEAIRFNHQDFMTLERETTLRNGSNSWNLSDRQLNIQITAANAKNTPGTITSVKIGQQQMLQAAVALGVAVGDSLGWTLPPVSSAQELVDVFNTAQGTEVQAYVGQEKGSGGGTFNNIKGLRPVAAS